MKGRILLILIFSLQTAFAQLNGKSKNSKINYQEIGKEAFKTKSAKRAKEIYDKHFTVEYVVRGLCLNPNIPESLALEIAARAKNEPLTFIDQMGNYRSYRLALASNPKLSPKALALLSEIPFSRESFLPFLHKALAANPNTPYDKLMGFMKYYNLAEDLAFNKSLKSQDLQKLFDTAENLKTTFGSIKLPPSGKRFIQRLIDNPKTPRSVLLQIKKQIKTKKAWWIELLQKNKKLDIDKELKPLMIQIENKIK